MPMTPMDNRLLRPSRTAPPGFGHYLTPSYNPDVFVWTPSLEPTEANAIGTVDNLIQLALTAIQYSIPFTCTWTLLGATYNPPPTPAGSSYYYAVDQDPGSRWGLPAGIEYDNDLSDITETVNYNWPGQPDRSLMFNVNGECVSVYTMLGEDNLFSAGRSMSLLGGIEVLFNTRQYKISLDPNKGAAWCIRRNLSIDNNNDFFSNLNSDVIQFQDTFWFASGYGTHWIEPSWLLADTYEQTPGCYPLLVDGGPPTAGWVSAE